MFRPAVQFDNRLDEIASVSALMASGSQRASRGRLWPWQRAHHELQRDAPSRRVRRFGYLHQEADEDRVSPMRALVTKP